MNKNRTVIKKHLKNIFDSAELEEDSVSAKIAHTAKDRKKYNTKFYNLDAILSVGYRVNSSQATQFRIWVTKILKEYIIKGFAMDNERLKNGRYFGKDYFKELKSNTVIAKNYLSKADSVNKFLEFNEYRILDSKGSISKKQAELKAHTEYDEFNKTQKIESYFDREMKKVLGE